MNWCDVISNKISRNRLIKENFLGEFVLAPKPLSFHWSVVITQSVGGFGNLIYLFFPHFVSLSTEVRQDHLQQQHLEQQQHQVTSNMNTLSNSWAGTNISASSIAGETLKIQRRHLNHKKKWEWSTSYAKRCGETSDASFPMLWTEWKERVEKVESSKCMFQINVTHTAAADFFL